MGFFRDPKSRSRGFGIGIFYFGLDRKISKIPKSRGSGSEFENPGKIPKNPECLVPGIRDFFGIEIFSWDGISRQKVNSVMTPVLKVLRHVIARYFSCISATNNKDKTSLSWVERVACLLNLFNKKALGRLNTNFFHKYKNPSEIKLENSKVG